MIRATLTCKNKKIAYCDKYITCSYCKKYFIKGQYIYSNIERNYPNTSEYHKFCFNFIGYKEGFKCYTSEIKI